MQALNLSVHRPDSPSDSTWYDHYVAKMGEVDFWKFKNKLYDLLDSLSPDQSIDITAWCQPHNYDLFIKIAYCYLLETNCCYSTNNEFTIIKKIFDVHEMEKTLELFRSKRRENDNGGDGSTPAGGSPGTTPVLTPESQIQSN